MTDNAHRRAMVAWAEQLEQETSPVGAIIGLEVRARIEKADAEDRSAFLESLPHPDDGYHHWHVRAGLKTSPGCQVCTP